MKTIFDPKTRDELKRRLDNVPGKPPLWGKMDGGQMLTHVADTIRMGLGQLPVTGKRIPARFTPIKQLMIYVIPWPKGLPTAPELISRPSVGVEPGVAEVKMLIDELGTVPQDRAWPLHPAFGKLSRRTWGVLGYKHLDHHLKQFGV